MATVEGDLVLKWRERLEITQEALGALCEPPMGKNGVYRIEQGKSRLGIATLLKMIGAIERAARAKRPAFTFGAKDAERLAMFFDGPPGPEHHRHRGRYRSTKAASRVAAVPGKAR